MATAGTAASTSSRLGAQQRARVAKVYVPRSRQGPKRAKRRAFHLAGFLEVVCAPGSWLQPHEWLFRGLSVQTGRPPRVEELTWPRFGGQGSGGESSSRARGSRRERRERRERRGPVPVTRREPYPRSRSPLGELRDSVAFDRVAFDGMGRQGARRRGSRRKEHAEHGAAARVIVDLDPAVVLLDDARAHREAQAGAARALLGRVERVEDLVLDRRRDADAGV